MSGTCTKRTRSRPQAPVSCALDPRAGPPLRAGTRSGRSRSAARPPPSARWLRAGQGRSSAGMACARPTDRRGASAWTSVLPARTSASPASPPAGRRAPWWIRPRLLVERPGVDDRLGPALTAQDDQEVRDHRRLLLLVELDDVPLIDRRSAMSTIPTAPSTIAPEPPRSPRLAVAAACRPRSRAHRRACGAGCAEDLDAGRMELPLELSWSEAMTWSAFARSEGIASS